MNKKIRVFIVEMQVAGRAVGTYDISQLGFNGNRCIPVIFNTNIVGWLQVSVAIQNNLLIIGNQGTQTDKISIRLYGWDD